MRLGNILLVLALAATAMADPRVWGPAGTMIRGEAPLEMGASVMNANGITCVIWKDYESGNGDIWGQLLDWLGNPAWDVRGRRLVMTEDEEKSLSVFPLRDGFLLSFTRRDTNSHDNVHFLAIDPNGNPLWQQNGGTGVQVKDGNGVVRGVHELPDGSINFVIENAYVSPKPMYGNRISSSGELVFEEAILLNTGADVSTYSLDFDDQGNLYFGWHTNSYHVAKYDADWTQIWHYYVLAQYPEHELTKLISVANEGVYLAFRHYESGVQSLKLDRLNSAGLKVWFDPVTLSSPWEYGQALAMAKNREGDLETGIVAYWVESIPSVDGGVVHHTQKVSADGTLEWSSSGIVQCCDLSPFYNHVTRVGSDLQGGAITSLILNSYSGGAASLSTLWLNRIGANGLAAWESPFSIEAIPASEAGLGISVATGHPNRIACSWARRGEEASVRSTVVDLPSGIVYEPTDGREWAHGLNGGCDLPTGVRLTGNRFAVVWRDTRASSETYFQIIGENGEPELEQHGRLLTGLEVGHFDSPGLCSDGVGGFFAAFMCYMDNDEDIRVARVRSDGSLHNDSLSVLDLEGSSAYYLSPECEPDGDAGVWLAWSERSEDGNKFGIVTRCDSLLNMRWPNHVAFENGAGDITIWGIARTPDDGCVVSWRTANQLVLSKLSGGGAIEWTQVVRDTVNSVGYSDVEVGSDGTIHVIWLDRRAGFSASELYAQQVQSDGTVLLQQNGVRVAGRISTTQGSDPKLILDDGVIVVARLGDWSLNNPMRVFKFNAQFQPVWAAEGMAISTVDSDAKYFDATGDGRGGVMVVWEGSELLGAHLNAYGQPTNDYWTGEGGLIFETEGLKSKPVVVSGETPGTFYCSAVDYTLQSQIRGQFIDESVVSTNPTSPPIVSQITLVQNYPNPFNASTEIVFSLPRTMNAIVQVFDVTGRLVQTLAEQTFAAGEQRIAFDASGLASGIYFYELRAEDVKIARKMLLLK